MDEHLKLEIDSGFYTSVEYTDSARTFVMAAVVLMAESVVYCIQYWWLACASGYNCRFPTIRLSIIPRTSYGL